MASKRYTLVFYAAIVVALIATFGVYRVLEATKASSRVATAPVVVAAAEIQEGRLIDRAAVTVAMWPVPTIPAGAYSSIDSVVNRVARINVFKGEPLVPGRLAPEGTSAGLEVKITPGKRAYSIRINDVSGIAGMIMPNSRVDILVTLNNPGDGEMKQRMAKIFMSNMRILAIGPNVQRGADGRPINSHVATLELTPEEVEKLAIAANQGSLSLALRGYGDPDSITTNGATAADVMAMLREAPEYKAPPPLRVTRRPAPPRRSPEVSSSSTAPAPVVVAPPPPPKPDTAKVQIFRGSKVETKKFETDSAVRDSAVRDSIRTP